MLTTTTWIPAAGPASDGADTGVWLAVVLVALCTLGGAWLARRAVERLTVWLMVASAVLLVIAVTDLLPAAWQGAAAHGVPQWLVGTCAALGFLVIAYFTRGGGAHGHDLPAGAGRHAPGLHRRAGEAAGAALFGGVGTAVALVVHRMLDGATLALAASVVVVVALAVHSASEGLAVAALLGMARRRLWPWLAISCVSPALGVVVATVRPIPGHVAPILLGTVAGVLARTAVVGFRLAAGQGSGRLPRRHLVVAGTVAATVAGGLGTVQWIGATPSAHEGQAYPAPRTNHPLPPPYEPLLRTRPMPTNGPLLRSGPESSGGPLLRSGLAPSGGSLLRSGPGSSGGSRLRSGPAPSGGSLLGSVPTPSYGSDLRVRTETTPSLGRFLSGPARAWPHLHAGSAPPRETPHGPYVRSDPMPPHSGSAPAPSAEVRKRTQLQRRVGWER
ncbi:hypothetical protein [Nonomuraea jiangxiensis]|uniref:Zinc transporter ZupT n=1 Tax=Nonomuraea jiangxiensis TaxID=633440 RepID=A0A1G7ZN28_9ACTN|nr:hypothetical protein [Nonomuraea jiangxiensis]SDH10049.1 Zinc transporter ZupT [Nonomuraea jiangxiensis]